MIYVTNREFWNRFVDLIAADDDSFRERYVDRFELDPLLLEETLVDGDHDWHLAPPGIRRGDIEFDGARRVRRAEQQEHAQRPLAE